MLDQKLFQAIVIVILLQTSSAKNGCGKLEANSYFDGDMPVGEVTFFPDQALQAAFQRSKRDYASYSWWKSNDSHPILFKISSEKMVIVTDTRFREVDNTLIIRGMNESDAVEYYVACSFDGKDGRTDEVELRLPDQIISESPSQNTKLNTATVSLIVALVVLFIGQFIAIAIFCFRRRIHPERTQLQRTERGSLPDRYQELLSRTEHRRTEGIDIFDRRGTSISIESNYDKIPCEILKSMPTISESRISITSPDRRSSGEHDYVELTEVIDCHVKTKLHYVNNPVGNSERISKRDHAFPPRGSKNNASHKRDSECILKPQKGFTMPKMLIDKNQQKHHETKMNEDVDEYLTMNSFDGGFDSGGSYTGEYEYPDISTREVDVSEYAVVPFRIQNQDLIKIGKRYMQSDSYQSDIVGADETMYANADCDLYHHRYYENQAHTEKNREDRDNVLYTNMNRPNILIEDNPKREEDENKVVADEDEDDMYVDMDAIRYSPLEASHARRVNRDIMLSPNSYVEKVTSFDRVSRNKSDDQIDVNEEDPYMRMDQISHISDKPNDVSFEEDDVHTSVENSFDQENDENHPNRNDLQKQDSNTEAGTPDLSTVVMRKKKDSLRREPAFEEDPEDLYMNMEESIEEWI